jgi:prophage DNA circulation protein
MTAFSDTLRQASFRGVPFEIDGVTDQFGRRWSILEFPMRDDAWAEDLGLKAPTIQIDAVLVGDDVVAQLATLRAALDAPGPGQLVHPFYGSVEVVISRPTARFNAQAGRVVNISFEATRVGANLAAPSGLVATGPLVGRRADAAAAALAAEADAGWAISDAVDWVESAVSAALAVVGDAMDAAARVRGLAGAGAAGVLRGLGLSALASGVSLVSALFAATTSVRGAGPARAASTALVASNPPISVSTASASTADARALTALLRQLVLAARIATLVAAARLAPDIAFESRDDALAFALALDDGLAAAADEAGTLGWDRTWAALADLRAATMADITARAAPLPRLRHYTVPRTRPSLVVAHDLDGEALDTLVARAADLVARNRIRHPGFVPGASVLEVLADG